MPNNTPGRTPKNFRALLSMFENKGDSKKAKGAM